VLIAESRVTLSYSTSRHCTVTKGRWYSDCDGATWTDPADVDIDHMVPLKEAWESGARLWSSTNRTRYANDLGLSEALVAVTDNVNQSRATRTRCRGCRRGPVSAARMRSTGCRCSTAGGSPSTPPNTRHCAPSSPTRAAVAPSRCRLEPSDNVNTATWKRSGNLRSRAISAGIAWGTPTRKTLSAVRAAVAASVPALVEGRTANFVHLFHLAGRVLSVESPNCCGMSRDEKLTAYAANEVLLVADAERHAFFLMSFGPELS